MVPQCGPIPRPVHPCPRPPIPGQPVVYSNVQNEEVSYGGGLVPIPVIIFCIVLLVWWTHEIFFGRTVIIKKVDYEVKRRW